MQLSDVVKELIEKARACDNQKQKREDNQRDMPTRALISVSFDSTDNPGERLEANDPKSVSESMR